MQPRRHHDGFTFLELMVVVMLLAVLGAMLLPGIPSTTPFQIRSASRVVAADLQYASQRAIATGAAHRWVLDLDEQAFRVEQEHERPLQPATALTHAGLVDLSPPRPEREFAPVENQAGNWRYLDEGDVSFQSIRTGDQAHDQGVVQIAFAPDGGADAAEVWLGDTAGRNAQIRVFGFTGEVRIDEEPDDG
jgi:prepilin-type N-terminal cleavage/methylation domain-containing protein